MPLSDQPVASNEVPNLLLNQTNALKYAKIYRSCKLYQLSAMVSSKGAQTQLPGIELGNGDCSNGVCMPSAIPAGSNC